MMLETGRAALRVLDPDSARHIAEGIEAFRASDGGFRGRAESSDLYYTAFALQALAMLGAPLQTSRVEAYLHAFGDGRELDLVHFCSLVRTWAVISAGRPPASWAAAASGILRGFRAAGGGYARWPGGQPGLYSVFLAAMAGSDLGTDDVVGWRDVTFLKTLVQADGSCADEPGATPTTPVTAAALTMRVLARGGTDKALVRWLLAQQTASGGFRAGARVPHPDLLSTATALFALRLAGADLQGGRERAAAFVESLWDAGGCFRGHPAEPAPDCEYTFYGLLALGCLA
jgi:hypothetical protein